MGEHVGPWWDGPYYWTQNGFEQLRPGVTPVVIPAGTLITPDLLANPMTFAPPSPPSTLTFDDVLVTLRQVESAGSREDAAFLRSIGVQP